jgi:hypothetical protein
MRLASDERWRWADEPAFAADVRSTRAMEIRWSMRYSFVMLHRPSLHSSMIIALMATLLAPVGCGTEKRSKECAVRCDAEEKTCTDHREKDCAERTRKCKEACEH